MWRDFLGLTKRANCLKTNYSLFLCTILACHGREVGGYQDGMYLELSKIH